MTGISHRTGQPIDEWAHVVQSIRVILLTPIGSRVMRRDFGSAVPSLLDAPLNEVTVVDVAMAVAEALDKHEPRFRLRQVHVENAGSDGHLGLRLDGIFVPRTPGARARAASAEVSL